MKLIQKIKHWFLPRESNNQKPKILHASGLLSLKVMLIAVQLVFIYAIKNNFPKVLGYAANISPTEVIRLTNQKRAESGLPPLTENSVLSQAALAKGNDMLAKDYWAHVSPDGTQPWYFFTSFGYSYRYAGENLARDFSSASSAVDAWMASPTHKENILSPNYKEIGIGVVEGDLAGVDTTIIVQFFGTKYADQISSPVAQVEAVDETGATLGTSPVPTPTIAATPTSVPTQAPTAQPEETGGIQFSPFGATKDLSLIVVGSLLLILIVDAIITAKRRVKRIGGRSFAHIAFLGMILAVILILKAGQIL